MSFEASSSSRIKRNLALRLDRTRAVLDAGADHAVKRLRRLPGAGDEREPSADNRFVLGVLGLAGAGTILLTVGLIIFAH